ncbi:MAG: NAD(P)-dependent oxidoreductase [Prevotellaceae bacterium]|nr:NAD(P)-dependent oxidoreductase [Prevotellaceae bacterium]
MEKQTKILITGASGFIGSFLCEEGLQRGMEVWAGVRGSSSRKWLQDTRLQFQTLDMTSRDMLRHDLQQFREQHGGWDIVVHAAGATKCLHQRDFDRNNFDCTVNLVETLRELDMVPRLFVYVSSLSVLGPIRERDYSAMRADDRPCPNTAYGRSKLKSEEYLRSLDAAFPYVIFRPTGVYGPREKDYFLMAKSIRQHVDFAVGYRKQEITFVYVADLVGAIYAAVAKATDGTAADINRHVYHVSDGVAYSSRAFSDELQEAMRVKHVLHVTAPVWFLRCVCAVSEFFSRLQGKPSTLNGDKYRIMKQRNWNCDIEPMRTELGYEPQWMLRRGTREAVKWYKEQGWL